MLETAAMKRFLFLLSLAAICAGCSRRVEFPGFKTTPCFGEQTASYTRGPGIKVEVNAPSASEFDSSLPTAIVLYGLPNGNTTDWTIGKQAAEGDDWHFQIQHIGAQTRYIRSLRPGFNLVTVYLEAEQLSWGSWRAANKGGDSLIARLAEELLCTFGKYEPYIVLSGHSGGGNIPFGFMDAIDTIPSYVRRIVFLDSNYNWDDSRYGGKLARWLGSSAGNSLFVACYDDANALLNGKPFVSPTGGTWYRSGVMLRFLRDSLQKEWTERKSGNIISCRSTDGSVQFLMIENPERAILHTVMVEKNGYVHSLLCGTPKESCGYGFMEEAAYGNFIQKEVW